MGARGRLEGYWPAVIRLVGPGGEERRAPVQLPCKHALGAVLRQPGEYHRYRMRRCGPCEHDFGGVEGILRRDGQGLDVCGDLVDSRGLHVSTYVGPVGQARC